MICIDEQRCDMCGTCAGVCPGNAVIIEACGVRIDSELCIGCRACIYICPVRAVKEDE